MAGIASPVGAIIIIGGSEVALGGPDTRVATDGQFQPCIAEGGLEVSTALVTSSVDGAIIPCIADGEMIPCITEGGLQPCIVEGRVEVLIAPRTGRS